VSADKESEVCKENMNIQINPKNPRQIDKGKFAKLKRQITANRFNEIPPTPEQFSRLRELDAWLADNTNYWHRHYAETKNDDEK